MKETQKNKRILNEKNKRILKGLKGETKESEGHHRKVKESKRTTHESGIQNK